MRLKITHRTEYRYDEPIAYALQRVRLMPSSGATQKVSAWKVTIEGAREEVRFSDHFDNDTRLISLEGEPRVIAIEASGEVETYNKAGVIGIHRGFAPLWLFKRETELTMPGDRTKALAAAVGEGVISPGGVGYDINCGMRLIRTDLTLADVQPRLERLMTELFRKVPAGVGASGFVRLSKKEFGRVMTHGAKWSIERGYGWHRDLACMEEGGCIEGADPSTVTDHEPTFCMAPLTGSSLTRCSA